MEQPSQAKGRVFKYAPNEIVCCDGTQWASYDYYTGIAVAKDLGLQQSTKLDSFDVFIVQCGDVSFLVDSSELPQIERRFLL